MQIPFENLPDFCRHNEKEIIGFHGPYRFLSNFHPSPMTFEGLRFPSVEAAFQAAKSLDPEARKPFQTMRPGEAKRAGRKLALRPDWEAECNRVMKKCLQAKFQENPELRSKLIATGLAHLEERNNHGDRKWGTDPQGKGDNRLGKILMEVRAEILANQGEQRP